MEKVNKTKFVVKFKITNKNIRLRFLKEKEINPKYRYEDMARDLKILTPDGEPDRVSAYKMASINPDTQRIFNLKKICPHCNTPLFKHFKNIEKWINDGTFD